MAPVDGAVVVGGCDEVVVWGFFLKLILIAHVRHRVSTGDHPTARMGNRGVELEAGLNVSVTTVNRDRLGLRLGL